MNRKVLLVEIGGQGLPAVTPVTRQPSNWVASAKPAVVVPPAEGVETKPAADSVTITWNASPLAGAVYVLWRAADAGGKPGEWKYVTKTSDTRYTYTEASGVVSWWKVTVQVNGVSSADSTPKAQAPVVPPTTAELVQLQGKVDQGLRDLALADAAEAQQRLADFQAAQAQILAESQKSAAAVGEVAKRAEDLATNLANEERARIQSVLNEKTERTADISAVNTKVQNGLDSMARSLAEVAAGSGTQFDSAGIWHFNAGLEGWTGVYGTPTIADGMLRPINTTNNSGIQSPAPLNIDGAAYRFIKLRMRKVGNPAWMGLIRWITEADREWNDAKSISIPAPAFDANGVAVLDVDRLPWNGPSPLRAIRLALTGAQTASAYIEYDWIAVGRPSPGASVAMVQQESEARTAALAAEAGQRNTLAVQLRGDYTGNDPAKLTGGLAYNEMRARVGADEALSQRQSAVEVRLPAGTGALASEAKVNSVEQASLTRDEAIGQRIDQVNATLPAMISQGANMILNGGWNAGKDVGWTYQGGSQLAGVSWPAAEGRSGSAALRIDGTGSARTTVALANAGMTMATAPAKKYRISCWYKTSATFNGTAGDSKLRLADQASAWLADRPFLANKADWTYLEFVYTVPAANVLGLRLSVACNNTAGTLWVDDVAVEEVTEILAVADGLSSLSGTVTQQAGLINAQSGLISALRTDVDGKATNSALQALQSQVTLQGNSITSLGNAVTSVTASLENIGGDNLLPNSGFETSNADNSTLPDWFASNTIPQAVSYSGTYAVTGSSRAIQIVGTAAATAVGQYVGVEVATANRPKPVPGAKYTLSVWACRINTDAARMQLLVQWLDNNNAGIGSAQYAPISELASAMTRHTGTFTAPAAAVSVRIFFRAASGAVGQNVSVALDNAMFQQGEVATNWAPSATEIAAQTSANAKANSALDVRVTNAEGQLLSQGTALTAVRAGIGNATVYEVTANAIITSQPTGGPRSSGARNAAGAAVGGAGRGLNVQVVNADSTLGQRQTFDTYGNGRSACASFNDWYDNALADNQYFILFTSDHTGSLNSDTGTDTVGTRDRLVDAGATRRNVEALTGTRMFILVGRKRAGEGAGMQRLSPPASTGRADQWVELIVEFVNGRPQGSLDVSALERATQANAAANSSLEARTLANESSVTSLGQSLTSVNARIDAIGGDNLLWNSSMEDAPVATAAPTGWNLERIRSDVGGTFSFIESPLSGGGKAVRIDWNAINAKDWVGLNRAGPGSNYVKVDPNTDYTLSSWVRGTPDARAQLYVQWMNATGGTVLGTVTLPEVTMTGKWQRLLLPARSRGDAVLARVYAGRLFAQQPGPHAIEIDNVQFQRGLVATEYAPSSMESAAAAMANAAATAGLTSTVTQQGQQITALGQSVTGVQAEVKGKASASVVQTLEAKVNNQGSGGNLLINSTFPKYQRNGWGWGSNPGAAWVELGDPTPGNDSFHPPGIYGVGSTSGGTTSTQIVWWGTEYGIPVEAGQTYMASAWFNTHRCSCYIEISYWDKTGNWLAQWGSPETGHTGNSGPPLLSEMPRPSIKTVAPPRAALARFRIIVKPNGEAWPYFWMFRPMFSRVEPDATLPPPWNAGGSESSAKWGFALDVNGNVSGMEMEATGAKSELKILSKILRLISPGTPDGMEIQDGYLRVWRGNVQRIIGNGFGPDGLIDYFGPNVGAAGATKRNATVWMDVNGGAYWGGAIAAGVRRNAMQTTTTQTIGASIVVGPFSTSGRNKNVVVSYQRTVVRTNNRMDRQGFVAGGNRNACAVNVYRKLGSNAEQFWTSFEASGGVSITNESDGPDMAISFWSGSVTLNDSEGTQDRTYRAEIVGFSEQDVSHQTGSFTGLDITASLSIVSIEE
ncbi:MULTISPECIES: carbohydrate binding domain-containing protein [Stenotrophomonas]|uniref:carbohydrate binding domain-containing protein n=1 Tax=Stenotrophomonas TaxID=40323 RepID=UPI0012AF14FD|nr:MULTISPECIES: carbohydrate binding domain-containing protein [Stenotrophomonas]MDG9842426.1 carbohydrate binding domain-containing protein [Stenotrophomonas sp. GD04054]MDH0016279.1 carbohydrate binding domain-containing protein [Stenotrophomonas sp. GD04028]MDH0575214.1 carbohydrate binding domain-containing protein [Stenotrophomonas sp. GD03997]MDH0860292.1 carbohydrate binding domain-containing protein [Stenotrophomonas sp. GD03882]QGM00768.1 hypothetical protein FEO89_08485 [Stenotropho